MTGGGVVMTLAQIVVKPFVFNAIRLTRSGDAGQTAVTNNADVTGDVNKPERKEKERK